MRHHQLHLRVGDLSTWVEFRRVTAIKQTPEFLQREYRENCLQPEDMDTGGVSGDLREGQHFTWCNDIRDGLKLKGIDVRKDDSLLKLLLLESSSSSSSSTSSPIAGLSSHSSDYVSATDTGSVGSSPRNNGAPRSKKRDISAHERFLRIKRNLQRVQKRRRFSTGSSKSKLP